MIVSLAGCKSPEVGQAAATSTTEAAAETTPETVTSRSEADGPNGGAAASQPFETTMIDDESYVVMTTSSRETTEKVLYETTIATETTTVPVVTTSPADANFDDIILEISCGADKITTAVDHVSLDISCVGDGIFTTGASYRLEKLENGSWKKFDFAEDMMWIEIAYEVSSHSSPSLDISLDDGLYAEPITAGTYRVVKTFCGLGNGTCSELYAGFTIEEADGEPQYEVEEENGSFTLTIDEIKPDMFVCEMPFPLPQRYYVICDTSKYPDYCVGDNIEVSYSVMYKMSEYYHRVIPTSIAPSDFVLDPDVCYKPVIYLYPEVPEQVSVVLDFNGRLTITDPEYRDGWTVTAMPDGTILHEGREYPYLFWEGERNFELDTSRGFCVSGADTEAFLREKLAYLGLNEREAAEFMEFWLPNMEKNAYNVITFAGADYTDNAKLDTAPSPDTVIRVFMVFSPSNDYFDIPAQTLEKAPERSGFTVVEWGGKVN
jgi:hypothetical protein